jgi:hypothetical protein
MNDEEVKKQHLDDANKALVELTTDTAEKEYRSECINEFITMIETGNTDHINASEDEDGKRIEHFK